MSQPVRLAVLQCDEPIPEVKEVYGSYGDIFETLLQRQLVGRGSQRLVVSKWDVVNQQSYPELEDIDAVLLSGSRHNSFENEPWILKLVAFVEDLLKQQDRIRVVGICFGHQIVARALGARVGRNDKGWELAVVPIELTPQAATFFGIDTKEISLHQMHRDIVYSLPAGVLNLGSTSACEIQGMLIEKRLWSCQGHPEFDGTIMREILNKRRAVGIFDERTYTNAIQRANNSHQGGMVLAAILRFLGMLETNLNNSEFI